MASHPYENNMQSYYRVNIYTPRPHTHNITFHPKAHSLQLKQRVNMHTLTYIPHALIITGIHTPTIKNTLVHLYIYQRNRVISFKFFYQFNSNFL